MKNQNTNTVGCNCSSSTATSNNKSINLNDFENTQNVFSDWDNGNGMIFHIKLPPIETTGNILVLEGQTDKQNALMVMETIQVSFEGFIKSKEGRLFYKEYFENGFITIADIMLYYSEDNKLKWEVYFAKPNNLKEFKAVSGQCYVSSPFKIIEQGKSRLYWILYQNGIVFVGHINPDTNEIQFVNQKP